MMALKETAQAIPTSELSPVHDSKSSGWAASWTLDPMEMVKDLLI